MFKKLAVLAGAGAILLAVAVPVLAHGGGGPGGSSNDVTIDNWAKVYTKVYTNADSGDNEISGKRVSGGTIWTGVADAYSLVGNDINSSVIGCVGCDGDIDIENGAKVYTKVYTKADSGDNEISGKCVSNGNIWSGAAGAMSIVDNLVNFSMVGVPK